MKKEDYLNSKFILISRCPLADPNLEKIEGKIHCHDCNKQLKKPKLKGHRLNDCGVALAKNVLINNPINNFLFSKRSIVLILAMMICSGNKSFGSIQSKKYESIKPKPKKEIKRKKRKTLNIIRVGYF